MSDTNLGARKYDTDGVLGSSLCIRVSRLPWVLPLDPEPRLHESRETSVNMGFQVIYSFVYLACGTRRKNSHKRRLKR